MKEKNRNFEDIYLSEDPHKDSMDLARNAQVPESVFRLKTIKYVKPQIVEAFGKIMREEDYDDINEMFEWLIEIYWQMKEAECDLLPKPTLLHYLKYREVYDERPDLALRAHSLSIKYPEVRAELNEEYPELKDVDV